MLKNDGNSMDSKGIGLCNTHIISAWQQHTCETVNWLTWGTVFACLFLIFIYPTAELRQHSLVYMLRGIDELHPDPCLTSCMQTGEPCPRSHGTRTTGGHICTTERLLIAFNGIHSAY